MVDDAAREIPHDPTPRASKGASRAVREALRLAGARERTVDDHMFRPDPDAPRPASFRLQLFTAPGLRPVAVATQKRGEGMSLTNAAEQYAAAVWERHCPDEEQPPVWVQHHLHDAGSWFSDERFELVTFAEVTAPYRLRKPSWHAITEQQLQQLVAGPVDAERGDGYIPADPEPEPEPRFDIWPVVRLGRPRPFRAPECMPTGAVRQGLRRWFRQLVPTHRTRECCWYHQGDWHVVTRRAIALLHQARGDGVPAEDMADYAVEQARLAGASPWEQEAIETLFTLWDAIQPTEERSYINGQHRAQAHLDQGVRRTVVLHHVFPDQD